MAVDRAGTFLFFSDLLGKPVVGQASQQPLGRIYDIVAVLGEMYPKVHALVVRDFIGKPLLVIPWARVASVNGAAIVANASREERTTLSDTREGEVLLREDYLDMQIVDTRGGKLLRVNDIHLLLTEGSIWCVHVDVGIRGLLRRLGWENLTCAAVDALFSYKLPNKFISWKFVQPLPKTTDPSQQVVKLSTPHPRLSEVHPADLVEIMEELNTYGRAAVFRALDVDTAAAALAASEPWLHRMLLDAISLDKAARILEHMSPNDAATVLSELPDLKANALLAAISPQTADTLRSLLSHSRESAGGLMTTAILSLPENFTAAAALQRLRESASKLDVIHYVYVVGDDATLRGVVTLRELFQAQSEACLADIWTPNIVSVTPETDKREVARIFAKYGFRAIPVVDEQRKLRGVIRLKTILDLLTADVER